MKSTLDILNEKYRELQALNSYKQYQVAELIGRDPGQLSRVLKGEGNEEVQRRFITVLEKVIEHHKLQDEVKALEEKLNAANSENALLGQKLAAQEDAIRNQSQQVFQTKAISQDEVKAENQPSRKKRRPFMLSRRELLAGGTIGVAGIAVGAMLPAMPPEKAELTIKCNYHPDDPILGKSHTFIKQWSKEIEELAPGRIKITPALVSEQERKDEVYYKNFKDRKDGFDMLHTVTYFQEADRYLTIFASIPFGMDSECFDAWFQYEGQTILREIKSESSSESDKFELLPLGNTGKQAGGWFFPDIPGTDTTPFENFTMRIYGLGREVLEASAIGTIGGFLTADAVEKKLKNGTVNFGVEYINAHTDVALGYEKVAEKYGGIFVKEGWQEPGTVWSLLVNEKALEQFKKAGIELHQLEAVTSKYHRRITNTYTIAGKQQLNAWKNRATKPGFRIEEKFPDELLERFREETLKIIKKHMNAERSHSSRFNRLFKSYVAFFEMWTGRRFGEGG